MMMESTAKEIALAIPLLTEENVDVHTAISAMTRRHPTAIGWLLTPAQALWVRWDGKSDELKHAVGDAHGAGLDVEERTVPDSLLATVFEARLFTGDAELRWTFDQEHQWGRSIVWGPGATKGMPTSDATITVDERFPSSHRPRALPESHRLFWGTVVQVKHGWAQLTEARLGSFWVPCPNAKAGGPVYLRQVEYTVTEPQHGNVSVTDVRFTGLIGNKEGGMALKSEGENDRV
ncbi:MAG: hypothetical protein LBM23_02300 [Propionibacteriaceae bacterium]|jgi:CRISPR-associated protein (TIGR03984 family)|nr:hypothetical protein [Propionibacteriaceae bacterium]